MKKYFKQVFFALMLAIIGFSFYPTSASAEVTVDVCIGSACPSTDTYTETTGAASGWFIQNPGGLPEGSIYLIIQGILNWLLAIFGFLGIIGFVISGIFYLVAAGDEGTMEKGKEGMKWSIIGVIVGLSGYLIVVAIDNMLNASSGF